MWFRALCFIMNRSYYKYQSCYLLIDVLLNMCFFLKLTFPFNFFNHSHVIKILFS